MVSGLNTLVSEHYLLRAVYFEGILTQTPYITNSLTSSCNTYSRVFNPKHSPSKVSGILLTYINRLSTQSLPTPHRHPYHATNLQGALTHCPLAPQWHRDSQSQTPGAGIPRSNAPGRNPSSQIDTRWSDFQGKHLIGRFSPSPKPLIKILLPMLAG